MKQGREHFPGIRNMDPLEPIDSKRVQIFQDKIHARIQAERAEDLAEFHQYSAQAVKAPNTFARDNALDRIPKSIELEKLVQEINFDILRQILQEIAHRSTLDIDSMNFINTKGISYKAHMFLTAGWDPQENIILLNPDRILSDAEYLKVDKFLYSLYILIHEESHAASRSICFGEIDEAERDDSNDQKRNTGKRDFIPADFTVFTQGGYLQRLKLPQEDHRTFYTLFEEGVNEKLAREVWQLYIERDTTLVDRVGGENIEKMSTILVSNDQRLNFSKAVHFIDKLVQHISSYTGFDEKMVWQAIIRSKFEAQDMLDLDIQEGFAEIFSPDFLDRLSEMSRTEQMAELLNEIEHGIESVS